MRRQRVVTSIATVLLAGGLLGSCGGSGNPDLSAMSAKSIVGLASKNLAHEPSASISLSEHLAGGMLSAVIVSKRNGDSSSTLTLKNLDGATGTLEVVTVGHFSAFKVDTAFASSVIANHASSSGVPERLLRTIAKAIANRWLAASLLGKSGASGFAEISKSITLANFEASLRGVTGPIKKLGMKHLDGKKVMELRLGGPVVAVSADATPLPVALNPETKSMVLHLAYPGAVTIAKPKVASSFAELLTPSLAQLLARQGL